MAHSYRGRKNSMIIDRLRNLYNRFNKQFWVVNTFELFERGAYYTMMAIFTYHFVYNVFTDVDGIEEILGGGLAILMALLYFMPLVSATLAEKFGYRPAFVISFIIMLAGYSGLFGTSEFGHLFGSIIALGVGAGAFKPMVSATIAHVTKTEDRNYGYSIYYWMINLGATIFPLSTGLYIEGVLGSKEFYGYSFLVADVLVVLNLVICFIWFKDPVEPRKDKKITKAFSDLVTVLYRDKKFLFLILIYSGFWFMFSVNHSFLILYFEDFGLVPENFPLTAIAAINPATIIIIGPFLSKVVDIISKKVSSLQLMITGISIFICGLLVIAFTRIFAFAALGIIIFSTGEFLTHPNFISYVSKIAPKDKVAMYMGYAFIPTGIGYVMGTFSSGFLYGIFAESMHKPTIFWLIVASIGVVTVALLLLYNIFFIIRPARKEVVEDEVVTLKKKLGRHIWNSPITAILILILVLPPFGFAAMNAPVDEWYREDRVPTGDSYVLMEGSVATKDGYSDENSETMVLVNISETNVMNVTFTLTWVDESDPRLGIAFINTPDEFSLRVESPDGIVVEEGPVSNSQGGEGSITARITRQVSDVTGNIATGDYNVTIIMGEAGNIETRLGIGPSTADNGNDWTLEISYDFHKVEE
jgi:MFS family permease